MNGAAITGNRYNDPYESVGDQAIRHALAFVTTPDSEHPFPAQTAFTLEPLEADRMPLLQFDASFQIAEPDTAQFAEVVTERFAELMATSTDHVAVIVRDDGVLSLGRQEGERLLFLQADVRRGRSSAQKRKFALSVMECARDQFDVPRANLKVTFTEHEGRDMMGYDRVGGEWDSDEV